MIFKDILVFTMQIQSYVFDLHDSEAYAKPLGQRFSSVPARFAHQSPALDWDWSRIAP